MFYWISISLIELIFLTVFSAVVFPKLILKFYTSFIPVKDRGLARFDLSGSVSILFEPDSINRKYFSRYQINQIYGQTHKCFIAEFAQNFSSVEYSIIVYNRPDRVKRIFRVKEKKCQTLSHPVFLPEDTDYVSVVVHKANGIRVRHDYSLKPIGYLWAALLGFSFASVFNGLFWSVFRFVSYLKGQGVQDILSLRQWGGIFFAIAVGTSVLFTAVTAILNLYLYCRAAAPRSKNGTAKVLFAKLFELVFRFFGRLSRVCLRCRDFLRNFFFKVLWSAPVLKIKRFVQQTIYKTKFWFRQLFKKAR